MISFYTLNDTNFVPWVEKYRPFSFEDIVGHSKIVAVLKKFSSENKLPHLFFYGPPGTGKTSMAIALAAQIYGKDWKTTGNILELNASDDRGIDVVREQIKSFSSSGAFSNSKRSIDKPKLVVLDEVDAMTIPAQNALRRIIEKYVHRVRFILIGNYSGQIIPALQSRCTKFRFRPMDKESMLQKLVQIIQKEEIYISSEAVETLVNLADGDMRKILNWIQAIFNSKKSKVINAQDIYQISSNTHPEYLEQFWSVPQKYDIGEAFKVLRNLQVSQGISCSEIIKYYRNRLLGEENISPPAIIFTLQELSDCQKRISSDCADSTQLSSIISIVYGCLSVH